MQLELTPQDAALVAQRADVQDFDMRRYQLARVLPVLRSLGFDGPPQFSSVDRGGHKFPFQVSVGYNVHDEKFFTGAKAQLYERDCFGVTGKGEAVLHVWTWAGSPSKGECKRIAAALTANGIPARATTYKKVDVVAFEPGDYYAASVADYHAKRAAKMESENV